MAWRKKVRSVWCCLWGSLSRAMQLLPAVLGICSSLDTTLHGLGSKGFPKIVKS